MATKGVPYRTLGWFVFNPKEPRPAWWRARLTNIVIVFLFIYNNEALPVLGLQAAPVKALSRAGIAFE